MGGIDRSVEEKNVKYRDTLISLFASYVFSDSLPFPIAGVLNLFGTMDHRYIQYIDNFASNCLTGLEGGVTIGIMPPPNISQALPNFFFFLVSCNSNRNLAHLDYEVK